MTKINKKQIKKYKKLNNKIKNIQDKVINETIKLDKKLKKRVSNKDDLLDDYEIDIEICFYLNEDDKKYREDKDNILARFFERGKYLSSDKKRDIKYFEHKWGKTNHNEYRAIDTHLFSDEYHCWWFYRLYSHTELKLKDLLQIGRISTDIKVIYQYFDEKVNL